MSEIAKVTKRTIDHYTNLGLLIAERSPSNYRYYDESAIEQLNFIEDCKQKGLSLDEIKQLLLEKEAEEIDVLELRLKMKNLEKDVTKVLSHFDKEDETNYEYVKRNISKESLSLIQTLLLLLN